MTSLSKNSNEVCSTSNEPQIRLFVKDRRGNYLETLHVNKNATVDELKTEFYNKRRYYPERQWFNISTVNGPALSEGTMESNSLGEDSTLVFKDLGVQISWRLVFFLEYLGPLVLFPIFYSCPTLIYGNVQCGQRSETQRVALWLIVIHFVKRELESLFLHRFSNLTMPIVRLPINCLHYWLLLGVSVGYFLFHPKYTPPFSPTTTYILAIIVIIFEGLNFMTHVTLKRLRPRGTNVKGIPFGWGFQWVSCANYLWESLVWIVFSVMIHTLTCYLFVVAAVATMSIWAKKRHRNYSNSFKGYPRHRFAIFPGVL